jgi:membrane protein required for colicin V production
MMLDLLILVLALLLGILGARRGAASQLASWGALVLAVLAARPGADALGPAFASMLHAAKGTASVAAGLFTFVVVLVLARLALNALLRGVLTFGNPERRGLDRFLGFFLGFAKVLAVAWVALSALAFVEERFSVSGKVFGVNPETSLAFSASKRWNFFGLADFGPAQSVMKLEQALRKPGAMARYASEPAVAALLKEPRFKAVAEDPVVRKAVEEHDMATLLKTDSVVQLLSDSEARAKLMAALAALQTAPPEAPPPGRPGKPSPATK